MTEKARIWDIVTLISAWAFFISLCLITTTPYNSIAHTTGLNLMVVTVATRFIWSFVARNESSFSGFIPWPQNLFSHLYLTFTFDSTAYEGHSPIGGVVSFLTLIFGALTAYHGLTDSLSYASMIKMTCYLWLAYAAGTIYQMLIQQIDPFGFLFKGQGAVYVQSLDDEEKEKSSFTSFIIDKLALPTAIIGMFAFASIAPTLSVYDVSTDEALDVAFEEREVLTPEELAGIETAAGRTNSLEETLQFTTLDEINRRSSATSSPSIGRVNIREQRAVMRQQEESRIRTLNPIDSFALPIQTEE